MKFVTGDGSVDGFVTGGHLVFSDRLPVRQHGGINIGLRAYESVSEARTSLGRYFDFYNRRRPHSSLDDKTPDQAYFTTTLPIRLAA